MKILVDLNVLLDVIQRREPHYAASADILSRIANGDLEGVVAGHTLTTIYYLVTRFAGRSAAEQAVDWILRDFAVVAESRELLLRARNLEIADFEDGVIASAAREGRCDGIVTRNVKDFGASPVPATTPRELLATLE